ncbi:MAG TPA: histidine kinase [Solirubrobacteraceae bacterium]
MTIPRPRRIDLALAAALGVVIEVELIISSELGTPLVPALLLGAVLTAAMAWRSTAPLAALAAVGAVALAFALADTPPENLASTTILVAILSFAIGAHLPRRSAQAGLAGVGVLVVVVTALGPDQTVGDVIFPIVLFGGCWALGRFGRGRARLTAELRARTEQLERERTERERDAVARERVRIARELHDVVAHSVSVMVVQAGAARSVLDRDPDASVRALGAVEAAGREALTEMRRLLGILRPDGQDADHSPQPSLDRLGALIARSRDAGLDVELRVEGRAGPLAPGVDLTAFRLVQEGLTNALKHGGRGRAQVVLRWSADVLEIEVANRIAAGPAAHGLAGGGQGLVGMRERVALCGGELRAGPIGRGFVVRARLPREHGFSSRARAAA